MNKDIYHSITKNYSFLDDYEKEYQANLKANETYLNHNKNQSQETEIKDRYLNNYPEFKKVDDGKERFDNMSKMRDDFGRSRYGSFVNKELDINKLDDEEYVYSNLDIHKTNSSTEFIEHSNNQLLKDVMETVKKLEYKYYAFLNKEFNILNMKMIKCSIVCYDKPNLFTVNQAKICAEKCHKNIKEAQKFTDNLNQKIQNKLTDCVENARKFENDNSDDKISNFFKCYQSLPEDFVILEKEIKEEFSNYI